MSDGKMKISLGLGFIEYVHAHFPVVKYSSTYKQALEVINKYCDFISENDKNLILGKNLKTL